jgi:hypothetical protein
LADQLGDTDATNLKPVTQVNDLTFNADAFSRHLVAEGNESEYHRGFTKATAALARYLNAQGMPRAVASIRREHQGTRNAPPLEE